MAADTQEAVYSNHSDYYVFQSTRCSSSVIRRLQDLAQWPPAVVTPREYQRY